MSRAEEQRMAQMRQNIAQLRGQQLAAAPGFAQARNNPPGRLDGMPKGPGGTYSPAQEEASRRLGRLNALKLYVDKPRMGYTQGTSSVLEEAIDSAARIPRGTEMYRALSDFDVNRLSPQIGSSYKPGGVTSVAGPFDLQALGRSIEGVDPSANFGGQNARANALAIIRAMEDLPGIDDVNKFTRTPISNLTSEGVLGPRTRFEVQGYTPATPRTPATWQLGAYANMGLGAANILGLLPMALESGRLGTGRMPTGMTNQLFPGANLLTQQDLIQ